MIEPRRFLRRHAGRLVAAAIILTLGWLVPLPELSATDREALAAQFNFERAPLPELPGSSFNSVRAVHPSLEHFSSWLSSVGASVALNDLDKDGLPNDLCHVDPRTNQVIVAPAPGTGARYEPFALDPGSDLFDPGTMAPMGCLPGDLNEDGFMDILVYYWGRTPIAFLNEGQQTSDAKPLGKDSYVPQEIVSGGERWYTNTATLADVDGDGHLDLLIGNYFPDGARILDANGTGTEQMQASMSRAYNGGGPQLLLWQGGTAATEPTVQFKKLDGVFDEQVAHGWTLAVGAADLDGDLLPEIYFANDFGPDHLLRNLSSPGEPRFELLEGEKTLTTPSSKALGHDSFKGMGVDFADLDATGLLDIFVSNITDEYALQESNFAFINTGELNRMKEGTAPYVDRSEPLGLSRSGWGWDMKLGDFANDGNLEVLQATGFVKGTTDRWPELHELAMGNPGLLHDPRSWLRLKPGDDLSGNNHDPFYVLARDGRYYDIATELGLGEPQVSRGIATADVDGDGKLDFAVANQWGTSYFYHNDSPDPGEFLGLHLLLPLSPGESAKTTALPDYPSAETSRRPAIGATATVYLPDGRKRVAQVDGGNGHSGKRSPDLHFGLGYVPSDTQVQVDLEWRDPDGQAHQETLYLPTGWHTVLLG